MVSPILYANQISVLLPPLYCGTTRSSRASPVDRSLMRISASALLPGMRRVLNSRPKNSKKRLTKKVPSEFTGFRSMLSLCLKDSGCDERFWNGQSASWQRRSSLRFCLCRVGLPVQPCGQSKRSSAVCYRLRHLTANSHTSTSFHPLNQKNLDLFREGDLSQSEKCNH